MANLKPEVRMPKQPLEERIRNFEEVAIGYTEKMAVEEAKRCLTCPNPQCVKGCPVGIDIAGFIAFVKEKKFDEAIKRIKERNALPAVCGRVCPQEDQCQFKCILKYRGDPVSIGRLERFVADWERQNGTDIPPIVENSGGRVAVVGGGPAGLTLAAELVKKGHGVEIFEALHTAGGVLMYGIPQFRLPKEIVQAEVEYVKKLGVKIHLDSMIGMLHTVSELFELGFDAIFIGSGAGLPRFMQIPGENLNGIYSANEFLIRINLMKAYRFPEYDTPLDMGKVVAVIGGGNVAMDAIRSALRMGTEKVYIVYRRGMEELPARHEEIENAEEEGVEFKLLTNPVRFIGDDKNQVKQIELIRMELGEPDESGRRRPVPIEGSEFLLNVDTVVIAIGQTPNPIIQQTTEGLATTRRNTLVVDEDTMQTNIEGIYAGGDVVSGAATVISAMGAGKNAANAIHEYIMSKRDG
ncbi:glutamate synthase (NADPH), homotetrameric [Candidatus Bathyarchaeota archaeon]|nr:glutamate synthase (NADPH), homotetrameric [Candidatus Bathyarchaeota archaeon]MDP6457982.1 NADPH-dependent glutamate synthase [Candidatus Bathyarchaeota archaeon]MDP7207966.1 NADPH-dependent glutamate synthase [Candidatus Bathyarchaeota archaeon]